jgi:hypothetical protein
MDTIDDRLEAVREYLDKYDRVEFDTVKELAYSMDHKPCMARIAFLLRQLDYAREVIRALDEADELPPTVQYALDVYKRRVSR